MATPYFDCLNSVAPSEGSKFISTVWDPQALATWTNPEAGYTFPEVPIDKNKLQSKSKNTPIENRKLQGQVENFLYPNTIDIEIIQNNLSSKEALIAFALWRKRQDCTIMCKIVSYEPSNV